MSFNPHPNMQAQEVIFTRKSKNISHPLLLFNSTKVSQSTTQKHLGRILVNRLTCDAYLTVIGAKVNKIIALLRKHQHILPRNGLITICKAFMCHYLNYEDILYNVQCIIRSKNIQYNACLVITGAIRGSPKESNYQELGFGIIPTSTMVSKTILLL